MTNVEVGKVDAFHSRFRTIDCQLQPLTTDITWLMAFSKDEMTRELLCQGGIWKPSGAACTLHILKIKDIRAQTSDEGSRSLQQKLNPVMTHDRRCQIIVLKTF